MVQQKATINFDSLCYYLAIILLNINYFLDSSSLFKISKTLGLLFQIIIIMLFVFKLIFQKYNLKMLSFYVIIGACIIFTSYTTKEYFLVTLFLTIICMQSMDFIKIIKCSFYTNVFVILTYFALFLFAMYTKQNINLSIYYNEMRYNMGFIHPNEASRIILWTMFQFFYLNFNKLKFKQYFFSFIILYITYSFTKTRTLLLSYFLFLFFMFLYKFFKEKNISIIYSHLCRYGILYLTLFSYISALVMTKMQYDSIIRKPLLILDKILSNRISFSASALRIYGITFLGQGIDYFSNLNLFEITNNMYKTRIIIDNFYIRCLVSYGLIYIFILFISMYNTIKVIKVKEYIFLILALIFSFSENSLVNIVYCFPILFIGIWLNKLKV